MFVYFISDESGPIKIGKSKNPRARLASMQTSSHTPLSILGVIDDADDLKEKDLHRKFDAIRLKGEWFQRTPELLDFIAENSMSSEGLYWEQKAQEAISKNKEEEKRLKQVRENLQRTAEIFFKYALQDVRSLLDCLFTVRKDENIRFSNFFEIDHIYKNFRGTVGDLFDCDWRGAERLLRCESHKIDELRDCFVSDWFDENLK